MNLWRYFWHFALFSLTPLLAHGALIYAPAHLEVGRAKIIVVIHGCLQSAESMALGTGWNRLADLHHLVIIYPQVPEGSNPVDCWSWYLPENQRGDTGQLKTIMDEIQRVRELHKVPSAPVYLAGISSGAATVAGLAACFPDRIKAIAVHSGPSYGLAQSLEEGQRVLTSGPPSNPAAKAPCRAGDFKGDVFVIHGSQDTVVNPSHAQRVIRDFTGLSRATRTREILDGGLSTSVSDFRSTTRGRGRLVMVRGLGHAWSGSIRNLRLPLVLNSRGQIPTKIPFFEEAGPSATHMMWEFFLEGYP